jgi:hypothetical protein
MDKNVAVEFSGEESKSSVLFRIGIKVVKKYLLF